jgi:hypothetical protein
MATQVVELCFSFPNIHVSMLDIHFGVSRIDGG